MKIRDALPVLPKGAFIAEIDGAKAQTLRSFYPRVAKALHFPDYFGKNLDALADCLGSLESVKETEVVLLIRNAAQFLGKEKSEKRKAALEVIELAEKPANRSDKIKFQVIAIK